MSAKIMTSFLILGIVLPALLAQDPVKLAPHVLVAEGPSSTVVIPRTEEPIKVDGKMNEAAWQNALIFDLPYEVSPGENSPAKVKTTCYLMYDDDHLYAGYIAEDPEPEKIRAYFRDRDLGWNDDYVALIIDTFNGRRRAFSFSVTPLGIQTDETFNEVGGGWDGSWDAIWDSMGVITDDGYIVEVAIPFSSLRFPRSEERQTWRILVERFYPRNQNIRMRNVPQDRNNACYLCQAAEISGFENLKQRNQLEIIPSFTASTNERTFFDGSESINNDEQELGVTMRWGITPNINMNLTVNPDFSGVEADAQQLEVNTRFALFFQEKRPFFLESADFFETPLQTLYTRTVADPNWGLKLTGKEGPYWFGLFVTEDDNNTILLPSNQGSGFVGLDSKPISSVIRVRRDIGSDSTIGVLITDRGRGGYMNRTYGLDGFLRFTPKISLKFHGISTQTEYPDELVTDEVVENRKEDGFGGNLNLAYEERNWVFALDYQDLDESFRADAGFIPRVDIRKTEGSLTRRHWSEAGNWFSSISYGVKVNRAETHSGLTSDENFGGFFDYSGPYQSSVSIAYDHLEELFLGTVFEQDRMSVDLSIQPSAFLSLSLSTEIGDGIDFFNAQAGESVGFASSISMQTRHFNMSLTPSYEEFEVDSGPLFDALLSELRLVYNFSARMFVRGIFQYTEIERYPDQYLEPVDPEFEQLFSQLLFSYKLNPTTLFLLGYSDDDINSRAIGLDEASATWFLKVSYAWRN